MQKVQNNQMAQDSSALKQQMKQQMQEQQKMKEEFQKALAQDQQFQKNHQELLNVGYNLTSAKLNPTSNNSGDFEVNYKKDGKTASIKGNMVNGNVNEISKTSSDDIKKMMGILQKNPDYNKYNSLLKQQGFSPQNPQLQQEQNTTSITIHYANSNNETASIKAVIEDEKVKEIVVEGLRQKSYLWIAPLIMLLILSSLLSYFIYLKYFKKKPEEKKEIATPLIDYRKEAKKLLDEAKRLFENQQEKDAYGKAAGAIRFYYSHKIGSKAEITNSDLINLLKKSKIGYLETQKCLNLCGLVEFAKYKANKKDFDEIIDLAVKEIR